MNAITYVGDDADGDAVYRFPNGRYESAVSLEEALGMWENGAVGHDPNQYNARWGPITKEKA